MDNDSAEVTSSGRSFRVRGKPGWLATVEDRHWG